MSFDYDAPAKLFLAKRTKNRRQNYRRFTTAAEAIRYAVKDLRTPRAFGAWLQVGDARFNSSEIQRLYEADDYPLRKPECLAPAGLKALTVIRKQLLKPFRRERDWSAGDAG
jgi:hypothetical protein